MKTLHTTTTRNTHLSHTRIRSIAILTGIVTAILCLVALRQEALSTERMNVDVPHLLETSKLVAADLLIEVKTWL